MITEKIGTNAGKLWTALEENGPLTFKKAKSRLKITNAELYMAMGWLNREDKVTISDDEAMTITLK